MATKIRRKKAPDILDETASRTDWTKLLEQIKENPILYGACAAFVLVCLLVGLGYRSTTNTKMANAVADYGRAASTEDPAERVKALEGVAESKSPMSQQALYMEGEAAIDAKDYKKAEEVFERLRQEAPDSTYTPDAVEGLGFLAENQGDYEKATATYKEIIEKWPGSLARRRQDLNIGRCQEAQGNLEAAIVAYQTQIDSFPNSGSQEEAKAALERLRRTHPEVFPKEAPPAAGQPGAAPAGAPGQAPGQPEQPAAPGAPGVVVVPAPAPAEGAPAPAAPAAPEATPAPAPAPAAAPAVETPAPAPAPAAPPAPEAGGQAGSQ